MGCWGLEDAWELAVVMFTPQLTTPVIGRLDRPTHSAKVASSVGLGRMGHPIKSGDDVLGWNEFGSLAL